MFLKTFWYDLENMIQEIFFIELYKDSSIYGLITFSAKNKNNKKLDLINPGKNLMFEGKKDTDNTNISFE